MRFGPVRTYHPSMAGPLLIRVTQVAELIGCDRETLAKHCRRSGITLLQVGALSGQVRGPLYLTLDDACRAAGGILGKRADRAFEARARRRAERQRQAFGAFRTRVEPAG